jgi:hypothetical protein
MNMANKLSKAMTVVARHLTHLTSESLGIQPIYWQYIDIVLYNTTI